MFVQNMNEILEFIFRFIDTSSRVQYSVLQMETCRTRVEQLEKELTRVRQERQKLQQQLHQPATGGVPIGGRLTQRDPQDEEAEQQTRARLSQLQLEYAFTQIQFNSIHFTSVSIFVISKEHTLALTFAKELSSNFIRVFLSFLVAHIFHL